MSPKKKRSNAATKTSESTNADEEEVEESCHSCFGIPRLPMPSSKTDGKGTSSTSSSGDNSESTNKKKHKKHHGSKSSETSSWTCWLVVSASILISVMLATYIVGKLTFFAPIRLIRFNDVLTGNTLSHKWFEIDQFFSPGTLQKFEAASLNGESFMSILAENSVESAGEARDVGHPDCLHPYMTLNQNRSICHFSNRLDVGMHFVRTGGFHGHMEFYERMVARIIPLRRRLLHPIVNIPHRFASSYFDIKVIEEFNTVSFRDKVKSICMDNEHFRNDLHVDPNMIVNELFQLDILVVLPGQELPMHLNVPYFWGADRYNLPQWLLVVMKSSKLFDHLFVPQVQGIVGITDHHDPFRTHFGNVDLSEFADPHGVGSDFYLYPYMSENKDQNIEVEKPSKKVAEDAKTTTNSILNEVEEEGTSNENKFVILKSKVNSAILIDGTQVVHGVTRFKSDHIPPLSSIATGNNKYSIHYDSANKFWHLHDYQQTLLQSYAKDEVKVSVVWNMHCFANEAQRVKFYAQMNNPNDAEKLSLEKIMEVFKNDLRSKKRLPAENIEPLELWALVLKEYLIYPKTNNNQNSNYFGINYCLLPNMLPRWITTTFLDALLKERC